MLLLGITWHMQTVFLRSMPESEGPYDGGSPGYCNDHAAGCCSGDSGCRSFADAAAVGAFG